MYNFYNVTADKTDEQYQALEKIKEEAYAEGWRRGREAGFAAGYAAAQGKPQEKIEAAYEQGVRDAAALRPLRRPVTPQQDEEMNELLSPQHKNGCGY